jgi:SAM-dependent methyltransferase
LVALACLYEYVTEGNETIARVAFYDRIANQWDRVTGYHGGALKRYALNDRLLGKIAGVAGKTILELGAGNGYFAPLMLRRFSGQAPERLLITDQSQRLLAIAQAHHRADHAEYLALDVQQPFSLDDGAFDLVLASMLMNELTTSSLEHALQECARVLRPDGRLLAAVPHPAFIHALAKKGALTDFGRGLFAMPSAEGIRLPVSRRPVQAYQDALEAAGFTVETEDIFPDERTLREKPGLKVSHDTPLALLLDCRLKAG